MEETAGQPILLEPGLRRILARNPSPLTGPGTNTYLIGQTDIAVIDPGPDDAHHLAAILAALEPGQHISHIFVTHSHLDHSPLARSLAEATQAPVLAFGDSFSGRSPLMQQLAASADLGGGEGVDATFNPDVLLADGEVVAGSDWSLTALYTPGHFSNHLAFVWNDAVFTGDLVMGWATSLVSPPDGDLTAFMASCQTLAARSDRIYYPGHGAPVEQPSKRIAWLIGHRMQREAQIIEALEKGAASVGSLTQAIYTEIPKRLIPAAERNVLAHLIDLKTRGLVTTPGLPDAQVEYALCQRTE